MNYDYSAVRRAPMSFTACKVASRKAAHPEEYCPAPHCLWRTSFRGSDGTIKHSGYCPRHQMPDGSGKAQQ